MCIFYILHNIFNKLEIDVDEKGKIEHGKRNCKLLLLGGIIYAILFTYIADRQVVTKNKRIDSLKSFLFCVFLLDISVMGYTYKHYFNRCITNECAETDHKYNYNEKTHTYTPKVVDLKKEKKEFL